MTNVETTTATTSDDAVTERIHEALAHRDLLPAIYLADTGSIDAESASRASSALSLMCSGRYAAIIIGKPKKATALPPLIFRSIGTRSR